MKLYFGNAVATTTTLMILALLGFIGWSVWGRAVIQYWGRRSVLLLVFGLVVCCFAAARDGLYKTIQNAIDGSCAPGLFPLVSIPTIVGCVGALLIIIAAIATPAAPAGLGVVRLSGEDALHVADKIFRPARRGAALSLQPGYSALYGHV